MASILPAAAYPAGNLAERLCAIVRAHPHGLSARDLAARGEVAIDKLPRLLAVAIARRQVAVDTSGVQALFRPTDAVTEPLPAPRSQRKTHQAHILELLEESPAGLTTRQIGSATGIETNNLGVIMRTLVRDGHVTSPGLVLEQTPAGRKKMRLWRRAAQAVPAGEPAPIRCTRTLAATSTDGHPPRLDLLGAGQDQARRLRLLSANHLRGEEYGEVRDWLNALADEVGQLEVRP